MANKFLHIRNTRPAGQGGIILVGLKEEVRNRTAFWTVALYFAEPREIDEKQQELAAARYAPIIDVPAGRDICFRVEHGTPRCRDEIPGGTPANQIERVEMASLDLVVDQGTLEHPGFHLMCECGSNWVSCGHDPPSQCCP